MKDKKILYFSQPCIRVQILRFFLKLSWVLEEGLPREDSCSKLKIGLLHSKCNESCSKSKIGLLYSKCNESVSHIV